MDIQSKREPKLIFFDTETTGLTPGNICQLSYIVAQGDRVEGKNFFFKVDYVPESASRIHGFTAEILEELSGGRTFKDQHREIFKDFESADVVIGHNVSFDKKFINKEFERSGKDIGEMDSFCTMWHYNKIIGKRPKLTALGEYLDISSKELNYAREELFGEKRSQAHDARYDTALTYLCWRKGIENGDIPKERFGIKNVDPYINPDLLENSISNPVPMEIEKIPSKAKSIMEKTKMDMPSLALV